MLKVAFQPEAEAELRAVRDHYNALQVGFGDRFVRAVFDELEAIADHPLAFPVYWGSVRRALPSRFPYLILFEFDADLVIVSAIVHGHRDPSFIQRRVDPGAEERL